MKGIYLATQFWHEWFNENWPLVQKLGRLNSDFFVWSLSSFRSFEEIQKALELFHGFKRDHVFRIHFYPWTLEHFGLEPSKLLTSWPTLESFTKFLEDLKSRFGTELRNLEIGVEPVHYYQISEPVQARRFAQSVAKAREIFPDARIGVSCCNYKAGGLYKEVLPFIDHLSFHWYGGGPEVHDLSDEELYERATFYWYSSECFYSIDEAIDLFVSVHNKIPELWALEAALTWDYRTTDERLYKVQGFVWNLLNSRAEPWERYTVFHFYGGKLGIIKDDPALTETMNYKLLVKWWNL